MKKKILIIAMAESIHTKRWVMNVKENSNFHIYLYPTLTSSLPLVDDFKNLKILTPYWVKLLKRNINLNYLILIYKIFVFIKKKYIKYVDSNYEYKRLAKVIKKYRPNIVHTLETQKAGYFYLEFLKRKLIKIPNSIKWCHTNWGSDIYLFQHIPEHKKKIINILNKINYYYCESKRDIVLAKKLGYNGNFAPLTPNTGGFNLKFLNKLKQESLLPSERKTIMIKGYQGWVGRALVTLKALSLIDSKIIEKYKILIYSYNNSDDMFIYTNLLKFKFNLDINIVSQVSHTEILKLLSSARVYIGLSISDGISTSFLESMATGCFPIQSNTSTANEWAAHKKSCFLVEPELPTQVAKYIKIALTNDELVNQAASVNWDVVQNKLDEKKINNIITNCYNKIINN